MIWEIKSSRDFALRGVAGFATAFTGTAFTTCGAAADFSNSAGIARRALCVGGSSVGVVIGMGVAIVVGTPSGALGVPVGDVESAAATTVMFSVGGGGGAGNAGRIGMSATFVRSCLVEIGARDKN